MTYLLVTYICFLVRMPVAAFSFFHFCKYIIRSFNDNVSISGKPVRAQDPDHTVAADTGGNFHPPERNPLSLMIFLMSLPGKNILFSLITHHGIFRKRCYPLVSGKDSGFHVKSAPELGLHVIKMPMQIGREHV